MLKLKKVHRINSELEEAKQCAKVRDVTKTEDVQREREWGTQKPEFENEFSAVIRMRSQNG